MSSVAAVGQSKALYCRGCLVRDAVLAPAVNRTCPRCGASDLVSGHLELTISASTLASVGQSSKWKGLTCHQTPDDLFNLAEMADRLKPAVILEVGTGEGGTSAFLRDSHPTITVYGIDLEDAPPKRLPLNTLILLDGNVYSEPAMLLDLEQYAPRAQWLVVCHTMRPDWGSVRAVEKWLPEHREWVRLDVPHPTQHTWLVREAPIKL